MACQGHKLECTGVPSEVFLAQLQILSPLKFSSGSTVYTSLSNAGFQALPRMLSSIYRIQSLFWSEVTESSITLQKQHRHVLQSNTPLAPTSRLFDVVKSQKGLVKESIDLNLLFPRWWWRHRSRWLGRKMREPSKQSRLWVVGWDSFYSNHHSFLWLSPLYKE